MLRGAALGFATDTWMALRFLNHIRHIRTHKVIFAVLNFIPPFESFRAGIRHMSALCLGRFAF